MDSRRIVSITSVLHSCIIHKNSFRLSLSPINNAAAFAFPIQILALSRAPKYKRPEITFSCYEQSIPVQLLTYDVLFDHKAEDPFTH